MNDKVNYYSAIGMRKDLMTLKQKEEATKNSLIWIHKDVFIHSNFLIKMKICPEVGNGNSFQYSCLGNTMDWAGMQCIIHNFYSCIKKIKIFHKIF